MKNIVRKFIFLFLTLYCAQSFAQSELKSYLGDPGYKEDVVDEVLSVDTLRLESGEKIKLIGLKAPEAPAREKIERDEKGFVIQKTGTQFKTVEESALEFVDELLYGKKVRLEFDVRKDSPEGTPAYVFLVEDNSFVNAEILRQGFAHLQISPPNKKYEQSLREAYREARREKRGLQGE